MPFYNKVHEFSQLGFLGLEYFFVLSSFLITYLILTEKKFTKKFLASKFLIRRALRVWPLYFIIVALGYLAYAIASGISSIEMSALPNPLYFLFFLVNFFAIENGMDFLFFMAFLWSISIEEQFYLFWAFLMKFYRKNVFPIFCLVLILTSILFRFYYSGDDRMLFFHTVSTLGNFGVGAYAAFIAFNRNRIWNWITSRSKYVYRLFYLCLLILIFSFHELQELTYFVEFQRIFYSVLFAILILIQGFSANPGWSAGRSKVIDHLGKISYGLYCYHGVVITVLVKSLDYFHYPNSPIQTYLLFPILIFAFTVFIAHLSYQYIEKPFLRIKNRFDQLISN